MSVYSGWRSRFGASRALVGLSDPAGVLRSRAVVAVGLALALWLLISAQRQLNVPPGVLTLSALGTYALGLALVMGLSWQAGRAARKSVALERESAAALAPIREQPLTVGQQRLVAAALVGAGVLWVQMRGRALNANYADVVALWLLAQAAALLASLPWPLPALRSWPTLLARGIQRSRVDCLALVAILVVALALRLMVLDRFPYVFGGDEGSQAMSAIDIIEGKITNPFSTGWYSVPTMYFYLQAASIKLFGDSVAGVRVVSALIGTLAVLFTYLLARRLFGRTAALLAAAFLAVYHYHLFFSRVASVQVADTLFVVASLYFLDRAFGEQRRVDAVLAGIALGFSQYFSFAGRLMLPVLGAYLLFALVRPAEKRVAPSWATDWQPRVRLAGWVLLSATVTAMPLLAYYVDHPIEFVSRLNQVSMLASGWLANELQATGKGAPEVIWWQIQRAILLPFYTPLGGWYRGGPPLAGEPAAVLMAIGMTLATLLAFHRRYFGLAVAYWGAVVGLGLTDDASATQRFVIVAPLLAIFLALGVYTLMRIGANLVGFRRADLAAVVAAGMVALAAWNIDYYFITPGVTRLYGDGNSLIATELGYYLRLDEANPTVYFFGVPRMAYRGFSSLPFIARRTHAIDVEKPWTSAADVPVIESPTAFVFLPGHEQELALVRQQYPGGVFTEFRFDQGGILFTVYEVVPQ